MKKNTNRVLKVTVWTVKKSVAQMKGEWFLRKVRQDCEVDGAWRLDGSGERSER